MRSTLTRSTFFVALFGLSTAFGSACGDDGGGSGGSGGSGGAGGAGGSGGAGGAGGSGGSSATATLAGHAVLPAATFASGPTSGRRISPANGQTPPFVDQQPVQGFSGIADNGDGTFWAITDNGFGSLENSADHHLRVYQIRPDFKTQTGGTGAIEVLGHIELRDPDGHIPFTITNHFTEERILTGADLDIESFQRADDGTLWFGDEFGPFLIHTSAEGVVLEPPFELPNLDAEGQMIRAPQNPYHEEASAVRIMNAVRRHAELHGNVHTPVFSPYHVMLKYQGSDPSLHYARGENPQQGLAPAAGDVFDIQSIQAAGYPIVTWTVNDKPRMLELLELGVNGIISDRPDLLLEAVTEFDGNNDGNPDYLTPDGFIDINLFDAQGHRGSRNLRPENTLPAMEAALDYLMVTLETDTGVTSDVVPVLNHDPYIESEKCRRADGQPYTEENQLLIKELTAAQIQSTFICDRLFRGESQSNDHALSPVSVQFAATAGLMDPYVMPTLSQLFDFVDAYIEYYQTGAGMAHPDAERRWRNAMNVRFNIETKLNPRTDLDRLGNIYAERTTTPEPFADAVAGEIVRRSLEDRADIQSFDFRTLLHVQETEPAIRTVYLFGDFPIYESDSTDDGTNLQDQDGQNSPWLAGMYWPYRQTVQTRPFLLAGSGGFEGLAMTPDGSKLLALLEKPLAGAEELFIHEFSLTNKAFTGVRYRFPLEAPATAPFPNGHAIGDFVMASDTVGLIIERDSTQGDLNGFKTIQRITLPADGELVEKELLVDLMNIADPDDIAIAGTGAVGAGSRFAFPFVTIENVIVLGASRLGVLNDNNFPFSSGRYAGTDRPDDNEFIVIELSEPVVPE